MKALFGVMQAFKVQDTRCKSLKYVDLLLPAIQSLLISVIIKMSLLQRWIYKSELPMLSV